VFQILSPLAVGIAASAVNGAISLIALISVDSGDGRPRLLVLAVMLWGFWIVSEGLLALVWLSAPAFVVLGGLAFGLPRSLLVAWLLGRTWTPAAAGR
jgi:hypothetical protein